MQPQYKNLAATDFWLAAHPDMAERVLKSLAEAEDFVARNPDETKAIVQKRLQYDEAYMAMAWPLTELSLFLDQSLITAMEDEARWMMDNDLTDERVVPDFLEYIYADALESVKPGAVNIIR